MFKLVPGGGPIPENSVPLASVSIGGIPEDMEQDEWVESMIEASKQKLLENGTLIPVLLFLFIDDHNRKSMGAMALGQFMRDENGKNALSNIAPKLLQDMNAYAMLFISEAWTKTIDADDDVEINEVMDKDTAEYGKNFQFHPDSKEVVMMVYETVKEVTIINIDIDRDQLGLASAGNMSKKKLSDTDIEKMRGRMVGWLHNSSNLLN